MSKLKLSIVITNEYTYIGIQINTLIHRIASIISQIFYRYKTIEPDLIFIRYKLTTADHNLNSLCSFYNLPLHQSNLNNSALSLNIDEAIKILF